MHFPYKKNNEVSWNYTCRVLPYNNRDSIMTIPNYGLTSSITNISGVGGITRNGCCYSLEELEKQRMDELERQRNGKEKEVMEEAILK